MADKSVGELIAATSVTPTDLFVLEQNGTAKKLTGQVLENWLVSFAGGHGGIHSIAKKSTSGLVDTYRITLADTTTFDFMVNNGKGISTIQKTKTSGLVDTYTIQFNDSTSSTFTVTNGAKGDKGDNQYVWIKYASKQPTASSHSFGDVPDNWIGIYAGASSTAPTDWQEYSWFQIKGDKGDTGAPATLLSNVVEYQVSGSGTIIPSGAWGTSIPVVAQGRYLWTRTTTTFNTGSSAVSYSVSRMGIDGTGSVSSVANISPDENGNVPLTAEDVGALPNAGGDMTGGINMNGQPISGLNEPTANDQAANMGFVNQQVKKAVPRNLLDNSDFTNPVNQRGYKRWTPEAKPETDADANTCYGFTGGYTIDRWTVSAARGTAKVTENGIELTNTVTSGLYYYGQYVCEAKEILGKTVTGVAYLSNGEVAIASGVFPAEDVTANTQIAEALFENGCNFRLHKMKNTQCLFFQFVIPVGLSTTVKYVAVYQGEYTEETLPEYQPKGYGAELAECQRYYMEIIASNAPYVGFLTGGAKYVHCEPIFPSMRVTPTITSDITITVRTSEGYSAYASYDAPKSSTVKVLSAGAFFGLQFIFDEVIATNNIVATAQIRSGKILLSADL